MEPHGAPNENPAFEPIVPLKWDPLIEPQSTPKGNPTIEPHSTPKANPTVERHSTLTGNPLNRLIVEPIVPLKSLERPSRFAHLTGRATTFQRLIVSIRAELE